MQKPTKTQLLRSAGEVRPTRRALSLAIVLTVVALAGCVSQGDFLRLQERVARMDATEQDGPDPFARIARLSADVEALRQEVRDLQGELELARKEAADALEEVRRTRSVIAEGVAAGASEAGEAEEEAEEASAMETGLDQELAAIKHIAVEVLVGEASREYGKLLETGKNELLNQVDALGRGPRNANDAAIQKLFDGAKEKAMSALLPSSIPLTRKALCGP